MDLQRDVIMYQENSEEIMKLYEKIKPLIKEKLKEFKLLGASKNKRRIFEEMVFCLLTPQSKAKRAWKAVLSMKRDNILYKENSSEIKDYIKGVRFNERKSEFIILLKNMFFKSEEFFEKIIYEAEILDLRNWLVEKVKGYGLKEASHFLRNIGKGEKLAILDRHILKNLVNFGVLTDIHKALSKNKYLEIEKKMRNFSEKINIPMDELDLVLWYKETGEVFK